MSGIYIKVRPEEPIRVALKRLKRAMDLHGVLRSVREHRHFIKPSERRRADKRRRKGAARQAENLESRRLERDRMPPPPQRKAA